ncbi:MAG: histidinol-phosphatase HisJ family protein [Peptostreptococcaceae bacterium]|nr:histidinol-phosphatase HisJ family protein [Peptostreptococcaceae bacterium]
MGNIAGSSIPRDYHIHTSYSTDSKAPMEEMIESSINKGLKEIALTDHVDFDFPGDYTKGERPFLVDYREYLVEFRRLQEKYRDRIRLLLGVEIGLQTHIGAQVEKLLGEYPFDFVIGSIHTVNRQDVYLPAFHEGKTKKESYMEYFSYALECAKMYSCYHVFGHLDYINRYGKFEDKILRYQDYSDIIDEILRTIIAGGKGVEINTSGHRYGLAQTHPQKDILRRYLELGGEIITVGSDAHRRMDIASHFELAEAMLRRLNVRYLTRFEEGRPIMELF